MWVLQNTKTKQYVCEFAEHLPLDTKDMDEAADFNSAADAELLKPRLFGNYQAVPKMQVVNKQRHQ